MFDELLQLDGVLGVVRYEPIPFFGTYSLHTFVYTHGTIIASSFVRGYGLWDCVPVDSSERLDDTFLQQVAPWVSFQVPRFQCLAMSRYEDKGKCPAEISSWEQLCSLARQAPTCYTRGMLDGTDYRHAVYCQGTVLGAHWSNPNSKDHPIQLRLIDAYHRLLATARLTPYVVEEAYGHNKKVVEAAPICDDDDQESELPVAGKKRRKPWQRRP